MKRFLAAALSALFLLAGLTLPLSAASGAGDNPFAAQDALRRAAIARSLRKGAYSQGGKSASGSLKNAYIVQFRSGASLRDIYRCVSGYRYSLLGDSAQRLFSVAVSDLKGFKSRWGGLIASIRKNRALRVQSLTPDDPYYSKQWALEDIKLPEAWDITTGSLGVKVAVIDTGFDRMTEDFNVTDPSAGNYISDGCDLSYIFSRKKMSSAYKPVTTDECGHGTAVTSVIASVANNQKDLSGACWNITVVPYKVGDGDGTIYEDAAIKALHMAADSHCAVVNMSFGTYDYDADLQAAINYAAARGCILVAASGNEGDDTSDKLSGQYSFPASYDNVVSVAAVNRRNKVAGFSQHNTRVSVAAPGDDILVHWAYNSSDASYDSVEYDNGTSFASPLVAAVAALVRSRNATITQGAFETLLKTTSTDLGAVSRDDYYGWGLINAQAMVAAASGRYYLKVGRSVTLPALSSDVSAASAVTYASSNAAVASVSGGRVTAVRQGTAVITASDGTVKSSYVVTVDSTPPKFGAVTFSTRGITRHNVKVTVAVSGYSSGKTLTYMFTDNGSFTLTVRDEAGNTAAKTVKVTNIDKTPPVIRATVAPGKKTSRVVHAAVSDAHLKSKTVTRDGRAVSWNSGVFRLKGKYVITALDTAGNKTVYRFTIV